MQQWLQLMAGLHKITERGLALIEGKPDQVKERLLEAHDLFSYLEENFPLLLGNLQQHRELNQSKGK